MADSCTLDEDDSNQFMTVFDNKEIDTGEVESAVQLLTADLIHDGLKFATMKSVTSKYNVGPPVDRDRLNAHPDFSAFKNSPSREGGRLCGGVRYATGKTRITETFGNETNFKKIDLWAIVLARGPHLGSEGYLVTGSSRFLLIVLLGSLGPKKANSFQPNPEAKRDYAN
ncbi:hypothetical protein TNCV_1319371 [Trichonephila clavipes]|nr:hypothetical protein TNCV_1319371 [Trichonephila clavipes]